MMLWRKGVLLFLHHCKGESNKKSSKKSRISANKNVENTWIDIDWSVPSSSQLRTNFRLIVDSFSLEWWFYFVYIGVIDPFQVFFVKTNVASIIQLMVQKNEAKKAQHHSSLNACNFSIQSTYDNDNDMAVIVLCCTIFCTLRSSSSHVSVICYWQSHEWCHHGHWPSARTKIVSI